MELTAHSSTVGGAITKQQNTRRTAMEYSTIISLDVSDKTSKVCIMGRICVIHRNSLFSKSEFECKVTLSAQRIWNLF